VQIFLGALFKNDLPPSLFHIKFRFVNITYDTELIIDYGVREKIFEHQYGGSL
jgi:hypothetical protein